METQTPITITKEYRWEMGHRLAAHAGHCRNLHGHSYRAVVALTGHAGENGMVLDFAEVTEAVRPIIDSLDHATMLQDSDEPLTGMLCSLGLKVVSVPFTPTTEELCRWMLGEIAGGLKARGAAGTLALTIHETSTSTVTMSQRL
ncbi:MAG: 6-carboxytetrahydropterin synthase [Armatimonadetes bacterium]|nr:6-carboxytetrahydropterin synthase [Armatimonadota bacterium]MBX3109705.1 6-carboxytetrahydropterin synthase [Fimbriimonadaceae bacterium]